MAENLLWLAGAFAVGWAIVFFYLFRISRSELEVRRRVTALEQLLLDRESQ
jgi:hypothetical protein